MEHKKFTTDILIIGGGGAAARAALEARRHGASVTIVSKESSFVGGATIMAAGGTGAIFNPQDNPTTFSNDIMRGGQYLNDPILVKILAERATESLFKLEDHGFILDRDGMAVKDTEGHTWRRSYLDRREALGFSHALGKALVTSGVVFYPDTIIFRLLVNNHRLVGALGLDLLKGIYVVFNAKATILATGGFGALYEITTNSATLTGDGCAMAWDVGAKLIDMEMVQYLPFCAPYPKARRGTNIGMSSLFGTHVKLFNKLGERYMVRYDPQRKEFATRDLVARANYTEIIEGRGTENGAIIIDPRGVDREYVLKVHTFMPRIFAVIKEVFGERAYNLEEPFEAIPAQHFCMGGIKINEHCETSVPSLFAVGEVAGGLHGANRIANTALTEILVFGDIAGERAARYIKGDELIDPRIEDVRDGMDRIEEIYNRKLLGGIRPFELKEAIRKIMWDHLGPVRSEDGMKKAIGDLDDIRENKLRRLVLGSKEVIYDRDRLEAIEVNLMIQVALLVAHSAFHRRESRGSHYRSDYPFSNDREWLKNVILSKGTDGQIEADYNSRRVMTDEV